MSSYPLMQLQLGLAVHLICQQHPTAQRHSQLKPAIRTMRSVLGSAQFSICVAVQRKVASARLLETHTQLHDRTHSSRQMEPHIVPFLGVRFLRNCLNFLNQLAKRISLLCIAAANLSRIRINSESIPNQFLYFSLDS